MKLNRFKTCLLIFISLVALSFKKDEIKKVIEHTYPVSSISPVDSTFDDLSFLIDKLKDKKIVFLGESGHGDGSTIEAKTRLIKFLHENLHYNVLAFEGATIFDLYYASSIIKRVKSPQIAEQQLKKGLYQAWSGSKEFQEMAKYIGQNIDSLAIIGIDNNFAMTSSAHYFPTFLNQAFNISSSTEIDYRNFIDQYNLLLTKSYLLTNDSTFNFDQFVKEIGVIKTVITESNKGSFEAKDYIIHELDNLASYTRGIERGMLENNPFRDRQMAENLFWATDNYYPNEKVIIWTANLHAAKNLDQAIYAEGDDLYQRLTTLAQHVSSKYGVDKVYSIACTSVSGATNSSPENFQISVPPTSWDYKIAQEIKNDFAFIDFAQIRKSEIGNNEFESTILGYHPHIGKWYNIFDGVLFIRNMKPSTFSK